MAAYEMALRSAEYLKVRLPYLPVYAVTLGTGAGDGFLPMLTDICQVPYKDIPEFPLATVPSHKGELILGKINQKPIAFLCGRWHYYEGYRMDEVVHAVRTLYLMGTTGMILTNAAGGLNPEYKRGDIVLIKDHLHLMPDNPLRGVNDDRFGVRFPDMSSAYDHAWRDIAKSAARVIGYTIREGVYASLQGPNLETPAEYKYLHSIGADLIGMSTTPETIAAVHLGMKVGALSIVSNECYPPDRIQSTSLEDVISSVATAQQRLYGLIREWINLLP